jgi:hypothetical protein
MTSASAMAEDACLTALRTERIGRIVLTQRAMPVAVPVSYLVTHEGVVVRIPDDDTSDWHAAGSVVALEADALDVDGGWSVLVLGMANQVTDRTDRSIRSHGTDDMGGYCELECLFAHTLLASERAPPRSGAGRAVTGVADDARSARG